VISKPKILAVDDYEETLVFLHSMIEAKGVTCDIASGVREAIEKFNAACDAGLPCYDSIIMDVDLPLVSGIGVLKLIRSVHPTIPVFLLTAYDSDLVRQRAKEFGATVNEKPLLDPQEFLSKVCSTATQYHNTKIISEHPRLILPEIVQQMIDHRSLAV